jgi:predicted amidohydrolase YtcJ
VTWEGPGFVDHHTHLLRVSVGARGSCDYSDPAELEAYHRGIFDEGSTPMDQPPDPPSAEDLPAALEAGLQKAADLGIVEVTEAGMADWGHFEALLTLRERGPLPTRVRIFVASGAADLKRMEHTDDPWVDIIGVKLYADGWLGPRTCALRHAFDDRPGDQGLLFLDSSHLARRIEPYAEARWTVATHAIGDRAIEAVLDAYDMVYGSAARAESPRIEHAQVLHPDLVARMADMGVVICIQPSFAVTDAEAGWTALGDRMGSAYRWQLLFDAGVRVIAGSDYPIETLDPLVGLAELVTGRRNGTGKEVAKSLDLDDALSLMTDAWAGATVLSDDPHLVEAGHLTDLEIVETRPRPS